MHHLKTRINRRKKLITGLAIIILALIGVTTVVIWNINKPITCKASALSAQVNQHVNSAVKAYFAGVSPSLSNDFLGQTAEGGKVFYGTQMLYSSQQANTITATYYVFWSEYVDRNNNLQTVTGEEGEYVFSLDTTKDYVVTNVIAPKNDVAPESWVPVDAVCSVEAFEGKNTSSGIAAANVRKEILQQQAGTQAKTYFKD